MKLQELIIRTRASSSGDLIRKVFEICVNAQVPGIPFIDDKGQIIGRISMRYILKKTCIPEFMIDNVHLLGNTLSPLAIADHQVLELLASPVDPFIRHDLTIVAPHATMAKVLAVMEANDTTYCFVVNNNCYLGIITIMDIAQHMLGVERPTDG